jgi:hypothetical protein
MLAVSGRVPFFTAFHDSTVGLALKDVFGPIYRLSTFLGAFSIALSQAEVAQSTHPFPAKAGHFGTLIMAHPSTLVGQFPPPQSQHHARDRAPAHNQLPQATIPTLYLIDVLESPPGILYQSARQGGILLITPKRLQGAANSSAARLGSPFKSAAGPAPVHLRSP